jgi:amidase
LQLHRVHGFDEDVLADHDGVGLARLVRAKEVSALEVASAAIERARRVDPRLRAIENERFELALAEARSPGNGFFAGIPTFIKDNTPVAGLPTNHGSAAVRSKPATQTGVYAQQILDQGFVCLGKSTLSEFGLNATTEPAHGEPTRNPWHTDYSCGASSGGSAALVAAGVVPIAHANDGGGSIRIPAGCCGLVGLKPTRGRHVVSEMARALPLDIISEGVVTRTVRDTAYFQAEAEQRYRNRRLAPIGLVEGPGRRRLRIGVVIDSITGTPTDAVTRAAVETTADLLSSLGHQVESVPFPVREVFADDFLLYWAFLAFSIRFGGRSIDPSFDASRLERLTIGLGRHFTRRFFRAPVALHRLRRSRSHYEKLFETYDAILTPVTAYTTPRLGHLDPNQPFDELLERLVRYAAFTPLANATGGPAISLPASRTDRGLPVAVQLMGNIGDERTLLELAYELEAARSMPRIQDGPGASS